MFLKNFFNRFKDKQEENKDIQMFEETEEIPAGTVTTITPLLATTGLLPVLSNHSENVVSLDKARKAKINKSIKLVDAILEAFVFSNIKRMNASDVYSRIDRKRLKNKHTTISSVKSTMYYLVAIGRLVSSEKRGLYQLPEDYSYSTRNKQ